MSGYETFSFHLIGISPLIVQNGDLANPLSDGAKALKSLTGKRKKTDADHEEIAKTEFMYSLYLDADEEPCIPGENIEAMLVEAAKQDRNGKLAKAGIIVDHSPKILFDFAGEKRTADALWQQQKRFAKSAMVRIGTAKVLRTRPFFRQWEMDINVSYLPDVVDAETVRQWMWTAGRLIAMGTWRPKHGRFVVAGECPKSQKAGKHGKSKIKNETASVAE